jgi:hypothetical protein
LHGDLGIGTDVAGSRIPFGTSTAALIPVGSPAAGRILVEIEIRAGFCAPDGELLAVLERSDWQRITARRRGEIVDEMVRVCDETEHGIAEAWRRRDDGSPRLVIGYWQAALPR